MSIMSLIKQVILNIIDGITLLPTNRSTANASNSDDLKESEQFQTECDLIDDAHFNYNTHPSIIHFSFNKAATQYIKSILTRCATSIGLTPVGINEYAFNTDFPFLDHLSADEMKKYRHIFKPKGYIYTVFGGMVEGIENLENYKVVLAVRDPRDMLVSSYYSQAFSHPVPDAKGNKHAGFMKRRELALSSTIDEYVINESDKINTVFMKYKDLLLNRYPHAYVTRYEDMTSDYESWLRAILEYCELPIRSDLFDLLVQECIQSRPVEEDVNRHIRKGISGDYKNKLLPATIDQLNIKFSLMLDTFGYCR